MMQPHLKIKKSEKYALLPGDPARVKKIAKYMNRTIKVVFNREFLTYKGEYRGIKATITSTGIGCPSAAIAMEELANCGLKTAIRVGTCGGLIKEMQPGDLVIPSSAFCGDGTTKEYRTNNIVDADKSVIKALKEAAEKLGVKYFVGVNRTHDTFYEPLDNFTKLSGRGFVSSEMECSALFAVAKLRGIKAGAVLVVNTPEPPEEVKLNPDMIYRLVDMKKVSKGIDNSIKVALEAVKILETNKLK